MSALNELIIIGNLTADPVQRVTQTGKTVVTFTVAVDRQNGKNNDADFFRVSAWDKLGETCQKYLAKGRKAAVIGSVSASAFKGQNGEPHASLEVTARTVRFLTSKGDGAAQDAGAGAQGDGFVRVDEEKLPF